VITLPSSVRIYLATGAVDLRKSIDGLGAIVSERSHDLYSGHLYVFVSRRGDRLKIAAFMSMPPERASTLPRRLEAFAALRERAKLYRSVLAITMTDLDR
jgi:hypothetical protein